MGTIRTLFRYYFGRPLSKLVAALSAPAGPELISFECNGCMAHDWRERDRGHVVDEVERVIYGSPYPVTYLVVQREDGSTFDCYKPYCHEGTTEMQKHTDNPEESLVGKLVYLN